MTLLFKEMNELIAGVGKTNDSSHLLSTQKKQNLFSNCNKLEFHQNALFVKWFHWQLLFSLSDKDKTSLWMSAASSHFKIERKRLILVRG